MSSQPLEITPSEVHELLRRESDEVALIDCREPTEYAVANIEGAVLMPMSDWANASSKLDEYSTKRVIVHCHHGVRSLQVVQWLRNHGFPDAQSMTGGIEAWSVEIDTTVPRY